MVSVHASISDASLWFSSDIMHICRGVKSLRSAANSVAASVSYTHL